MKIIRAVAFTKDLSLAKPYTIAGHTFSSVENLLLAITLANGITGVGAASPAPEVTGETCEQTLTACNSGLTDWLIGKDIRHFKAMIKQVSGQYPALPALQAAIDMALHDAFCQWLEMPIATFYGQQIKSLPTSVTIGIMDVKDTLEEARAFVKNGFKVLKIKTGLHAQEDAERTIKVYEEFGNNITIRVDANQGYDAHELHAFLTATGHIPLELIEQPLPVGQEKELLRFPEAVRKKIAADESLKDIQSAVELAAAPKPYGIYNIKLMKCGGISNALDMAQVAKAGGIDLFWGCNDESIISITAALHAAFSCPNTKYLDLDGSFDLLDDVVKEGFILKDGWMYLSDRPGLGTSKTY